nr:hypothetical protein [Syntrophobotulus glycolicus]
MKNKPREGTILILLLCMGLCLRIAAAVSIEGFSSDIHLFRNWAGTAADNLGQFYFKSSSDYPPLYIYVLFLIGKLLSFPAISPYTVLIIKLPAILADLATALFIFKVASKYHSRKTGILLAAYYLFNPAVWINSSLWGQVDSFFTLLIVAAVYLLTEKKLGFSAVFFTAAVLMKPQGIIFLPVLFFELVRTKKMGDILKAMVSAIITALIIILPFSLNRGLTWIYQLFAGTVAEYPYASVNAFNLYGLLGANYVNDAKTLLLFSYHRWGLILIVLTTLFSWLVYIKGNSRRFAFAAAMLQIMGVFTLATRMHERYLFPAIALAVFAWIYLKDKRLFFLAGGVSVTSFFNTFFILFHTSRIMDSSGYGFWLRIISLLNVLLLIWAAKTVFDLALNRKSDDNMF